MKPFLALLLSVLSCYSAAVKFEWDESPDIVTGYRLYIGTNVNFELTNCLQRVDTANTNAVFEGVVPGKAYWAKVTATNDCCESLPSNEVMFLIPRPPVLKVKMQLQASAGVNGPWAPADAPCLEFETPITQEHQFFRALVSLDR